MPEDSRKFTHTQLLVRAFIGTGLISASLYSLAWCLIFSLVLDLMWVWVWVMLTLASGLMTGIGHYIGFRLFRYRKLTPNEREDNVDGGAGIFVRRKK